LGIGHNQGPTNFTTVRTIVPSNTLRKFFKDYILSKGFLTLYISPFPLLLLPPQLKYTFEMSSQIPISAPRAAYIPSLNKVLAPFYGSFWGTRIAIFCSANLLQEILELGDNLSPGDKETHMRQYWHQMLQGLRNPNYTYYYKDPESLQVAQVLARLDSFELTQELATKSKYMNGQVLDAWASQGDNYFTVARGTKWLCDCARRFLPKEISPSEKSSFLQNLRFMATPQPKYLDIDVRYPIEEDTQIFG
jgi:hypothetical protein